jgi:hypothetical protein
MTAITPLEIRQAIGAGAPNNINSGGRIEPNVVMNPSLIQVRVTRLLGLMDHLAQSRHQRGEALSCRSFGGAEPHREVAVRHMPYVAETQRVHDAVSPSVKQVSCRLVLPSPSLRPPRNELWNTGVVGSDQNGRRSDLTEEHAEDRRRPFRHVDLRDRLRQACGWPDDLRMSSHTA